MNALGRQLDECITAANHFLSVAQTFSETIDSLLTGNIYPCMVNAAFACELFLKAIKATKPETQTFPKGHDLKILFDNLEAHDKNKIDSLYKQEGATPLGELLEESASAFVEWRYAYEKQTSGHPYDLITLGKVLNQYVRSIR